MSSKPKIKPWRPQTNSTPVADMLAKIELAISMIYNLSGLISYQEIYKCGFDLVHANKGQEVYTLITNLINKHISSLCILSTMDLSLLETVHNLWITHRESLSFIKNLMLYVENTFIKEKSLQSFYDFGTILFKEKIYMDSGLGERLSGLLIDEAMKDKNGVVLDKNVVKSVIDMLIQMGLGSNLVYREVFEQKFLKGSENFYKEEAGRLIEELPVSEYLKFVDKRLEQEEKLCREVIDASTRDGILSIVDECFVVTYFLQIVGNSNLTMMIDGNDLASLKLLYKFLMRTPKLVQGMSDAFSLYIQKKTIEILHDQNNLKKPTGTIALLLDLIDALNFIMENAFSHNRVLEFTIKNSFEANLNISHRVAIYLCIYLDSYLTKGIKFIDDLGIEKEVVRVMNLFILIRDKDVFEAKHKEFLALRLLEGKSLNLDAEKMVIKYLKQECGLKYVSKLEGMINDMSASALENAKKDFSVLVLTTSFWPQEKLLQVVLPDDLSAECNNFTKKYCGLHTGRRLNWRYEYGSSHIKALLGTPPKPYDLIGSIYQGCILLMFNHTNQILLSDLLDSIKGSASEVKKHVLGLVKAKVLLKTSKGRVLNLDDNLSINLKYIGKLNRVKLEVISTDTNTEKKENTSVDVTEDRKYFIEAGIVRIMKSRKTLEHKDLITELIKFCEYRFSPDVKMIKDRVEALIEKEILRRDLEVNSLYHYIA